MSIKKEMLDLLVTEIHSLVSEIQWCKDTLKKIEKVAASYEKMSWSIVPATVYTDEFENNGSGIQLLDISDEAFTEVFKKLVSDCIIDLNHADQVNIFYGKRYSLATKELPIELKSDSDNLVINVPGKVVFSL